MISRISSVSDGATEAVDFERRSSAHHPLDLPVKVRIKDNDRKNCRTLRGKTNDISTGGAGILLDQPIPESDRFDIEMNFANVCPYFEIPAKIRWVAQNEDGIRYGISFIPEAPEKITSIKEILARLEKNDNSLSKNMMVPRKKKTQDTSEHVHVVKHWLKERFDRTFPHINSYSFSPDDVRRNIENFVGVAQTPVGVGGPIKVNGQYAQGNFYVPFATTEGTLVETYQHGMLTITRSGGANVVIVGQGMDISPVFLMKSLSEAIKLDSWLKDNFQEIKAEAEKTTRHGRLTDAKPVILGRRVMLQLTFDTADAMGMNIANVAASHVCELVAKNFTIERYFLRSNFSSDKKPSGINLLKPYGKEIVTDVIVPRTILKRFFGTEPEKVESFFYSGTIGSIHCGMTGMNAHFANGLAAIFVACGQDVAQIVNASIGISTVEVTEDGDLYVSAKLPNLIVGTVGGGTSLPTQRECLEIMGCHGNGKASKFAEIVAATMLAGELSIAAALAEGYFIEAHQKKRNL